MEPPAIERLKPEDFLRLIEKSRLGKLKIYLGHAAGVGKTYAMLEEAHRLKKAGVDVVIGWIETHGRKETEALLEDLEIIPRKKVPHAQCHGRSSRCGRHFQTLPDGLHRGRTAVHQRRRLAASQALPRSAGFAAGGHQRHHGDEHPASRKPARHRAARDGRGRARARARPVRAGGRPDCEH